jgi:hypothetical protein
MSSYPPDAHRARLPVSVGALAFVQRNGYHVGYVLLVVVLSGFCLIHVTCWLASYLDWPWSPDHDVFATLARSWDAGVLPYRDMLANNPPTTIYLYWVLGKTFGWGRTVPFFAFDGMLIASLAIVMLLWSERVFSAILPGLVGYFLFLRFYLPLDYTMIGERDWHASLLAAFAIMVIQGWPGRRARMASALAMALAVATRPQAALFLPAVGFAIAVPPRGIATSRRIIARNECEFAITFAGLVVLMFVPLLLAGILGDFLQSLRRAAYGGLHDPLTAAILWERVSGLLAQTRVSIPIAMTAILSCCARPRDRRIACVWLAATMASLFYKPISPRQHNYLDIPGFLFSSTGTAAVVGLVLRGRWISPWWRLGAVLLLAALPGQYARSSRELPWSYATWEQLRGGEAPILYQTGYFAPYTQYEYGELIGYVKKLAPDTLVANALAYPLAITGPTGRLSAFPAESLAWVRWVRPEDEEAFLRKLEQTTNSVVVLCPGEFDGELADLARLKEAIQRLYEPEKRFFGIEVWRRRGRPGDAR